MDERLKKFGKRIAWLRTKRNITQERLAELIGYSPNHISKLESARTNPSFDLIMKIADALHIEPQELFKFEDSKDKQDELIEEIIFMLKDLKYEEQMFVYKTVKNLIEI